MSNNLTLEENIKAVSERLNKACQQAGRSPNDVTLVAVTKTIEPALIADAFELGIRNFGENRVQEAMPKLQELSYLQPPPIWHMIGHLQTNKAKTAAEIFDIIHSVDSVRLAEAISRHSQKVMTIFLEVNVSGETTKSGFPPDEAAQSLKKIFRLPNLEVKGLMTIAPMGATPQQVRAVFHQLRQLRDSLGLEHLSMGMTDDFEIAIEEGATMVRIGRAIFGEREKA